MNDSAYGEHGEKMRVGKDQGKVILSTPERGIAMEPVQARLLANALHRYADAVEKDKREQ